MIFLDFFKRFERETSFVHKDFITTFLSLKFFEILLMLRGNVYKNVHKNCVMNICMNKMLAVMGKCHLVNGKVVGPIEGLHYDESMWKTITNKQRDMSSSSAMVKGHSVW